MTIVGFHRVLIVVAILFCLGFGVREAVAFAGGGGWLEALLAVVFLAAGVALGVYLANLERILGERKPG